MAQPALPKMDRLGRFRELRARLDPTGWSPKGTYVESPSGVTERMAAELQLAPKSRVLLIGGVGSGKSTSLRRVMHQLSFVADTFPLYLDVSQDVDIEGLEPGALTRVVGHGLVDFVEDSDRESVSDAIRHLQAPDFHPTVAETKRALAPVVEALHRDHQHMVVLLDGLDRLTSTDHFQRLVRDDMQALGSLGIGLVVVGPLRALYSIDRALVDEFDAYFTLPWMDVEHDERGRTFLEQVLLRRFADVELDAQGLEALVHFSGGVVRDLLSLAQSACVDAYLNGVDTVGLVQVDSAVDAFGRKHMQGIRPAELAVLHRVHQAGIFVETDENDLALLMTRRVLEYRGDDQRPRYVVHPTIAPLLAAIQGDAR